MILHLGGSIYLVYEGALEQAKIEMNCPFNSRCDYINTYDNSTFSPVKSIVLAPAFST